MQQTNTENLRAVLKSQYHSAIAMVRDAIEKYPEEHWFTTDHTNAAWQIAYHTLYFTEFYARPTWGDFTPWLTHGVPTQNDDGIPGPPDPKSELPLMPEPFTKEQVLSYAKYCDETIDQAIEQMDITSPESGFYWYKVSKFEHQLINIRHTQHGAAQLADRLRQIAGLGVKWVGARHPKVEEAA
jgi:hypothetical protein